MKTSETMFADYQQTIHDTLDKAKAAHNPKEARHDLKNLLASLVLGEKDIKIALSGVNRKAPGSKTYVFAPPDRLELPTW